MPKLAKATSPNDGRVAEAVALLVKCPALTLEQVMLAVRFTAADAANRAKQAWIRRRAPLKKELRTPTSIQLTSSDTTGSTLTVSPLKHAPPNPKLCLQTSGAVGWLALYWVLNWYRIEVHIVLWAVRSFRFYSIQWLEFALMIPKDQSTGCCMLRNQWLHLHLFWLSKFKWCQWQWP